MSENKQKVLVIGEVFVDFYFDSTPQKTVRLGGIFHAARALSSLEIEFALAYYSPTYLDEEIQKWAKFLNAKESFKLGNIKHAPNVMLISNSKEDASQAYENVLCEQAVFSEDGDVNEIVKSFNPSDIIIFPGRYNTKSILDKLKNYSGKIHMDIGYDSEDIIGAIDNEIDCLFISTSSNLFEKYKNKSPSVFLKNLKIMQCNYFIVKENRGGSYCYDVKNDKTYEAGAFLFDIVHSVGVGDVYDCFFIARCELIGKRRVVFSSFCAAYYASTLLFNDFKANINVIKNDSEICSFIGKRLSWFDRSDKNIYIAAPDFPYVDNRTILDNVNECLKYHNFSTRLPIRENGLVERTTSPKDIVDIYNKDIKLLHECDLLIGVLLYNDPGTLVEIGMFKQLGKPVIIYDPFQHCDNMFVLNYVDKICYDLDELIRGIFDMLGENI